MKKFITILLVVLATPVALGFAFSVLFSKKKERGFLSAVGLFDTVYADVPSVGEGVGGGSEGGVAEGVGADAGGNAAAQGNASGGPGTE